MSAQRLYKPVRPSTRPLEQPDDPKQVDKPEQADGPLREEDEERLTQRLYELDRSSAQFPERLDELLQDEGWMEGLRRLSQHKSVELIDYLDNVRFLPMPTESCSSSPQILGGLDRTGSQFREGLYMLREICSLQAILPTTYEVSGELVLSSTRPVASGGSSEIYKGSIGGADVCIKTSWMFTRNRPVHIQRVSYPHTL